MFVMMMGFDVVCVLFIDCLLWYVVEFSDCKKLLCEIFDEEC